MQDLHTHAVFPIIFDDSSDFIGSVELGDGDTRDEGLLAKSNVRAALLSMSGYGKPQYSDTKGKLIYQVRCLVVSYCSTCKQKLMEIFRL